MTTENTISPSRSAKVLLVEGKRPDRPSLHIGLKKKGFEVEIAISSKAALACLDLFSPDVVIVDAASLKTSGRRICSTLRQWDDELPIILIMDSDHLETPKAAANVVLTWPFTLQKLVNRMRPFLPAEGKNVLRLGPIRLDLDERRVLCLGSSANLTPLLMKLLKVLMEHHGEVVERHELFRQVWDTEYTADTRTLDVHISWLRQAIEMDPRHPRFLKTVRGVGYRLDVEQR